MKRRRAKRTTRDSAIEQLPHDLIVEIVVQVVANSDSPLRDLQNIKGACKSFRRAVMTRAVARCVPVEKEENLRWWNKEHYIDMLKSCASAGNLEASFLLGIEYIFDNDARDDKGFMHLSNAANGGHNAARYTLGILFFRSHDAKLRRLGIDYLNGLDPSSRLSTSKYVEKCREKVINATRNMWMKKLSVTPKVECTWWRCGRIISRGDWDFQHKEFCSESCKWNDEYYTFFKR